MIVRPNHIIFSSTTCSCSVIISSTPTRRCERHATNTVPYGPLKGSWNYIPPFQTSNEEPARFLLQDAPAKPSLPRHIRRHNRPTPFPLIVFLQFHVVEPAGVPSGTRLRHAVPCRSPDLRRKTRS